MKKRVLIIGKKSFVGINLHKFLNEKLISKKISFNDFKTINITKLKNINVIINCSIKKKYLNQNYKDINDIDLQIAKKIKNLNIKYIFLSSRKVYSPGPNLKETSKTKPFDKYGKNKLITEKKIKKILINKLLILRVSNILGAQIKKTNRKIHKTFLHIFFDNLKSGYIFNNKKIYKDFIPISKFNYIIYKLIQRNKIGLFNISYGKKIFLSKLIKWLLKYSQNKYKIVNIKKSRLNMLEFKSFYLNNLKLRKELNIDVNENDIKRECHRISKIFFK